MLVWRRSLSHSHRYKMFSVVVSWTNNKDPTSDKEFGSLGSPVQQRGCPSLTKPFSILGTDIKAASTPLEVLTHPTPRHIHRNKDRHAHVYMHTHAHTHTPVHSECRKYACHGQAGKNNFLSTGIRKTMVERGSA